MTEKDPYKDSPYDAAGMPLGTKVVDTGAEIEQRRFASVKQVIPPENTTNLIDNDYQEEVVEEKKLDPRKFNSAIEVPLEKQPEGEEKDKAIAAIDSADDDSFLDEKGVVKEEAKADTKDDKK